MRDEQASLLSELEDARARLAAAAEEKRLALERQLIELTGTAEERAKQRDELVRFAALRDDAGRVAGARLGRRATRATEYAIRNASRRAVPALYVDHTADASKGGFEIVSAARRDCQRVLEPPPHTMTLCVPLG